VLFSQTIVLLGFVAACFINANALLGFFPRIPVYLKNRLAAFSALVLPSLFHFIPFFVDGYDLLLFAGITGCSFGIVRYQRSLTIINHEEPDQGQETRGMAFSEMLGMLLVYALGAIAIALLVVQLIVNFMEQSFPLDFYI